MLVGGYTPSKHWVRGASSTKFYRWLTLNYPRVVAGWDAGSHNSPTSSQPGETLKHALRPRAPDLTFSNNLSECPTNPQVPLTPQTKLMAVWDFWGGRMNSYRGLRVLVAPQIRSVVRNSRGGRKNSYPRLQVMPTPQIYPGAVQVAVRGRKRTSHQPPTKVVAFIHYGLARFSTMIPTIIGLSS